MADVITIDNVEYVGYEEKEPETIKFMFTDKYTKIFKEDYCYIQKGSYLMYNVDEEVEEEDKVKNKLKVKSGVLLKFIAPSIFVFKNDIDMCIWSINIEESDVYIKDKKLMQKERKLKDQLFKLYNEGYIKILDEPMVQED